MPKTKLCRFGSTVLPGCCFALLLLAGASLAQSTFGTILGTVRDPQSAVIAGAKVIVRNPERNSEIVAMTNENGDYSVYPVPEGGYTVLIEAHGFQRKTINNVRVDLNARLRLDAELAVAAFDQSVTIEANTGAVQSESATLQNVVENEQILALPLDGRNILDLAFLTAGATRNVTQPGLGEYAVNGNRPYGNSFILDGVTNRDEVRGQSSVSVSVDAVRQFTLKSANATAEFGGGGTQMALVVKSGTNKLHGSLFAFNRSQLGQARSFFSRTDQLPGFLRNQFGGSFGGPLYLPRFGEGGRALYDGHNKTFFFVNYEGTLIDSAEQSRYSVPTLAMRDGNFEGVLNAQGRPLSLVQPSAMPFALAPGQPLYLRPNVINPFYLGDTAQNPNRQNIRLMRELLNYYETPNGPGDANNFSSARPTNSEVNQFTFRIDHQLTIAHSLAVRNTVSRNTRLSGDPVAYALSINGAVSSSNGVASLTSIFRPNLVGEFRFGWQRFKEAETVDPARNIIQEFGIPEPSRLPDFPLLLNRIPTISFLGNGNFHRIQYRPNTNLGGFGGDGSPFNLENGNYSLNYTMTWQKGKHEIKGGWQYRHIPFNIIQVFPPRGGLSYSGRTAPTSTGHSIADALLGLVFQSQFTLFTPQAELRAAEHSAFLQTDWRVTRRLTMNIGLRWEARQPAYEERGQMSAFDLTTGKIIVPVVDGKISDRAYPEMLAAYRNIIVTATEAGWDERRLINTDWLNLAPRYGFALALDNKGEFVLRGAYGIFNSFAPYFVTHNSTAVPFGANSIATSSATNVLSNANPFRLGIAARPVMNAISRNFLTAYNQQWNLTLERSVLRGATVSVSYVGNRGVHLMGTQQRNPGLLVYPAFSNVTETISDFSSIHNALQVEFRRRYAKGLFMQFNWTWAKSIDDLGGGVGNAPEDFEIRSLNRRLNRADSDFVNRHVARGNFLWEMPFGKKGGVGSSWPLAAKALFGQWSLGGIVQYNTGVFFTPRILTASFNGRPDLNPSVPWRLNDEDRQRLARELNDPTYLDRSLRWFNPRAFTPVDVAAGRIGNAGRNLLIGPAFFNADAVLSKRFHLPRLPERVMGTVRVEVFNLFNNVNFNTRSINGDITSSSAGAFTLLQGNPRQMQFGFRVDF